MPSSNTYEIYAIRYATSAPQRIRNQNFIIDPNPTSPHAMDFFSWVLVAPDRQIVIDTGMSRLKAERHGHVFLREPADGLRALGLAPESAQTVILSHLHFDHIGNIDQYPAAHFYVQKVELEFATGPDMRYYYFRRPYSADEIGRVINYLYEDRVTLHGPDLDIAPGVSLHLVGGHCAGQEIIRVKTERGWVVLASDALHYYEEYERSIPFTVAYNMSDMLRAHEKVRQLADSDDHIVPGHDPLVLKKYPAARPELKDFVIRLDVPPQPLPPSR
ncbi:N-acyl homoserine lactonase family protein [Bradyrhizobium sp.]|uniref:N-acyl homoserine lactonase family protein n=1 Tax=Bradyrhizobium sp. TaxID=376 RepID=UPI0039E3F6D6